ncbi:FAD dependent oxidoreductase [Cenococcum geophilum 1.58]|uniref:FAD dependent oxidoreductase n=1 Tax=Cenococcum geophilum 1.58 TaxID=794803 RepID=UPI00358F70F5|nr:FAD dependent oxidoreductase [Cenococcum geophilum 1.58]
MGPRRHLIWAFSYLRFRFPIGLTWISSQETVVSDATATPPESTVILGAGVIGLSTAYYLALTLNEATALSPVLVRHVVVVVEPSNDICPGASGQATGGLGDFGFGPETTPLGSLSYLLHKNLASEFGGKDKYGFNDLNIYRVSPKNFTGTPSPPHSWGPAPPVAKNVSDLPNWIEHSKDWTAQLLADDLHSSHLDPRRFCQFLRERCEKLGVKFLLNSTVTSLERDDIRQGFASVTIRTKESEPSDHVIPCNSIVIAAGPWTDRVFMTLFPAARLKVPMNATNSAGNHILVRNPHWKSSDDEKGNSQVFLNGILPGPDRLDITAFVGGSLYLGGYGATPEPLPDYADSVEAQPDKVNAMIELARKYLCLGLHEKLEVLNTGRCYRPLAMPNKPIITKVEWDLLGDISPQTSSIIRQYVAPHEGLDCQPSPVISGLYINTGHNSDGVTLAPGSGKVMSELLLGRTPSVDISRLGLDPS